MRTFNMTAWHTHTLALQRGTVIAAARNAFVIKSTNHSSQLWYVNHGTKFLNVGGSRVGMRRHDRRHHGDAGRHEHEHEGQGPRPG